MASLAQLEAQSPALLILAYLCHNCHVNTARAFATELRRTMPGGGAPGTTPNTGGHMMTGFESGYGVRPMERDLVTGIAFITPLDSSGTSLTSPAAIDTSIVEVASTTACSPSVVPSIAQLKDSDGDDIMSPPPHEQNEAEILPSFDPILVEPDAGEPMPGLLSAPLNAAPSIILPEDAQPEPPKGASSIEPLIKQFDSGAFLEEVSRRKMIRDHILWGRLQDATAMLEEHFPNVLRDRNPPPSTATAPTPSSTPLGRQSSNPAPNTSSLFVYPVSLAPAHLNLNLRIQSFIEAVRTRPLAPPPPPPSHLTPHHALSLSPYYSPASSPSPPTTGAPNTARSQHDQSLVLHLGKELVQIVNSLPDPTDRAIFLKELDGIWALMAYPEPEAKSPANVSKYLQYDRRLALADQINSAILQRTGQNPRSALEQYVRSTGAVWNSINDHDVQIPADPKRYPPGVAPPPSRPSMRIFPSAPSGDTVPGPPFDFARFMDSR